jgi:hypothetical protein
MFPLSLPGGSPVNTTGLHRLPQLEKLLLPALILPLLSTLSGSLLHQWKAFHLTQHQTKTKQGDNIP